MANIVLVQGLGGRRVAVALMLTVFALFPVNVRPVWAVTITPNPPIAGQPITFSGSSADVGGFIFSGSGCTGSVVGFVSTGGPGPYSYTLTSGLPAGSYSVQIIDDITPPTGCVDFTVTEAPSVVIAVPWSICTIQLGVQESNGTTTWLPGYAYPGTQISECQNVTDMLGEDVLDRTVMFHQFIMNGTSFEIVVT